jgi:ferritin-like metal-binding protein YciE
MPIETLEDLFIHELSDMYSAEKQLTKALPKLAKAAFDDDLAEAFRSHLEETQDQVSRLERILEICGFKAKREKCDAMEGLIKEGAELIEEMEKGPVRDTALISAAQKVEHYEIAGYLSLLKLADQLDYRKALPLLNQTLDEEEGADEKLSDLCDRGFEEEMAA